MQLCITGMILTNRINLRVQTINILGFISTSSAGYEWNLVIHWLIKFYGIWTLQHSEGWMNYKNVWAFVYLLYPSSDINTLRHEQNGWPLADKFWNGFCWMKSLILCFKLYSSFICEGPIDNKSALVQVMAWCLTCNKLLPEPMLTKMYDAI